MRKRTLYLETSIFGFWFDEHPVNAEKRQAVTTLLKQVRDGQFNGLVCEWVIEELRCGDSLQVPLLKLVRDYRVVVAELDEVEAETLASEYLKAGAIEAAWAMDARHVAAATLLEVDALVSLNLKHIVNTWRVREFNAVNLRLGYRMLTCTTPAEVIEDVG